MTKEQIPPLVREESYRKQIECPSCGRYIGTFERCPYCQANTPKRLSIRVFKLIAVLTSTVGLLLLLFYAQTVQTQEIRISEIGPLSNFAHVRIVGKVDQSYGVHPQWNSLAFTVSQMGPSSEPVTIRVSAYSKVAKEIQEHNLVPEKDDQVSVEGTVRFQKDNPSLLINTAEHLKITKRAPPQVVEEALEPGKVSKQHVGKTISVKGKIVRALGFARGSLILFEGIDRGFGVWISSELRGNLKTVLHDGDLIEATGKVKAFKDNLEVEVFNEGKLKIVSRGQGEVLSLSQRGEGGEDREDGNANVTSAAPSASVETTSLASEAATTSLAATTTSSASSAAATTTSSASSSAATTSPASSAATTTSSASSEAATTSSASSSSSSSSSSAAAAATTSSASSAATTSLSPLPLAAHDRGDMDPSETVSQPSRGGQ